MRYLFNLISTRLGNFLGGGYAALGLTVPEIDTVQIAVGIIGGTIVDALAEKFLTVRK